MYLLWSILKLWKRYCMNLEIAETYALAAVGAVQGFARYYVRPELTARRAWAAVGLGVIAYDLACPQGEQLSEGVDRALDTHRLVTLGAIGVTAAHLANVIPPRFDPFKRTIDFIKK